MILNTKTETVIVLIMKHFCLLDEGDMGAASSRALL